MAIETVKEALAQYGATLDRNNRVWSKQATPCPIWIELDGKKVKFVAKIGVEKRILEVGPANFKTVERFVDSFWFWEKRS